MYVYVCIYVYLYMCMYIYMYVCIYVYIYIYICICMYMYICMYITGTRVTLTDDGASIQQRMLAPPHTSTSELIKDLIILFN